MGIVYTATNLINGKKYVGITMRCLEKRRYEHIHGKSNSLIHKAILKYGESNFVWSVLYESDNEKELLEMEVKYAADMNAMSPFGYNLYAGDCSRLISDESGGKSRNFTDEQRKIRREIAIKRNINHKQSDVTREKLRVINTGKFVSESSRRKMSESRTGKSHKRKSFLHKDSTLIKMRSSHIGKKFTMEHIDKCVSGRFASREHDREIGIERAHKMRVIRLSDMKIYSSVSEAANDMGVSATAVSFACRGKNDSVRGYKVMYLGQYEKINDKN